MSWTVGTFANHAMFATASGPLPVLGMLVVVVRRAQRLGVLADPFRGRKSLIRKLR